MNMYKFFLIIFLLNFSLTSCCGQTQTEKKYEKTFPKINPRERYPKVISDSTNKLTDRIEKLEVAYTAWGCKCPQWIQTKDLHSTDTTKAFIDFHFYIEPAAQGLKLPIYFNSFRHILKIEGQFYEKEDYPQGTIGSKEPMPKAKVFRYTNFKVLDNPDFKSDNKVETLTLVYNALACTCAQWSEAKYADVPDKRIYYWLEAASEELIQADTLFNGTDLPLQIRVTGRIVSESGFPKTKHLANVSHEDAGNVFRYTKIKIIKNGD